MRILPVVLALLPLFGADLEISRPARTWEYMDATGPKAAFFGKEDGTLEAWVYPMKIFKDMHLRFRVGSRLIPAEAVVRSLRSRPGSSTLTYSGDEFQVEETIAASATEPGLLIHLAIQSWEPVTVEGEFVSDFQLMWPASMGSGYAGWDEKLRAWTFGADGQPFAAVFGGPQMDVLEDEYANNYTAVRANRFTLGSVNGRGDRWMAVAGAVSPNGEVMDAWKRLLADPARSLADAEHAYASYLDRTVKLEMPDASLQRAYDWSRLSVVKGMVDNPMLGRGLVAGYGPSKGAYRPGFAWFFGRDSFWTSFALTAAGDFENARAAIEFIARFQRTDGKIPHEISQAASLVDWFKDFPYAYASADATALYVIAVRDYAEASGDVDFIRQHWVRVNRAFDFLRSTAGTGGFPKNLGVGHGWVEGGPLLPVQVELYQAGCYVEAMRSMARMSRIIGDTSRADVFDKESDQMRRGLDESFWLEANGAYAFALASDGKPVNEPSVLATVPMWFGVLDAAHSRRMIETLATEAHAADWGMRIIGSDSPKYGPAGYHYGSVWPLFTGWASTGEYRYHQAAPALANLRANAWLALDGAGGNTTEVLSGATYSPLSTSSPHQTWSAAMVISPILRGMLGLAVDAPAGRLTFAPHLPASWDRTAVSNIPVGKAAVDLVLRRFPKRDELEAVNHGDHAVELEFAPAYAPATEVTRAPVEWKAERTDTDWHPHLRITLKPGRNTVVIEHTPSLGYTVPWQPPTLAEPSANLKVIAEHWLAGSLELRVAGLAGREYTISLTDGRQVPVKIGGTGPGYHEEVVRIPLNPPQEGRRPAK